MNNRELFALWLFRWRQERRRQNRLLWVHPINQRCEEGGLFYILNPFWRFEEWPYSKFFNCSVCLSRHYDELHNRLKRIGEPSWVLTLFMKCSCLHQVMRSTFMGTLLLGTPISFMQLLLLKSDANRLLRNHSLITFCFKRNVRM